MVCLASKPNRDSAPTPHLLLLLANKFSCAFVTELRRERSSHTSTIDRRLGKKKESSHKLKITSKPATFKEVWSSRIAELPLRFSQSSPSERKSFVYSNKYFTSALKNSPQKTYNSAIVENTRSTWRSTNKFVYFFSS